MALKKQNFADDEISVFDDAIIYKRGEYWHFRMWLAGEGKYARKSLKTRNRSTAVDRARDYYLEIFANQKAGKKYFSLTAKEGVALYLKNRERDVESGIIVKGRFSTIKTHLEHWLDFIGRDTKLKEMDRADCRDYFHARVRKGTKTRLPIGQTTVVNEQSTINAMMAWLFKSNETHVDHFEFKKLPRIDKKDDAVRRSTFEPIDIIAIGGAIVVYWAEKSNSTGQDDWRARKLACFYFLIASVTGLRTGEQRKLTWKDVEWIIYVTEFDGSHSVATIKIRAETSKVRQSRKFMVRDNEYFMQLKAFQEQVLGALPSDDMYVFSLNGRTMISERTILYHFGKLLELANVESRAERNLVPYSFRHYFITQKLVHGLTHRQVADICGTSIAQIEKTYYHVDEDMMEEAALIGHLTGNDGIVIENADEDYLENIDFA